MGSANRGTAIAPLSTIGTRYGNSVSTASMPPKPTSKISLKWLATQRIKEKSRYGISVSTPHRRYGHRLRTPFLRTPFPRLLRNWLCAKCLCAFSGPYCCGVGDGRQTDAVTLSLPSCHALLSFHDSSILTSRNVLFGVVLWRALFPATMLFAIARLESEEIQDYIKQFLGNLIS